MSVVYEIARWSEVFETSESRKLKSLPWIAERTDFTSTGWQAGLDEFGPAEWLSIYGAWMVIVRTAATAKSRGRLCGDKGEPWSAARIARPSGTCPELIARAFSWAVKVGWLVPADFMSGDSPDNLPTGREKITATRQDSTEQDKTERNGTGPLAEPSRAEVSKSDESQTTGRPASVKLPQLAKASPLLQELERRPVKGSGVLKHGSIFGRDRIRPDHITTAEPAFWLNWYQDQLSSDSPELRCGNQAEAAFVLAAVFACRRIPEAKLTKSPRVAVWIRWMKERECGSIMPGDFDKAAAIVVSHFGGDRPAALPVWRDVEPQAKPAGVPKSLPPEMRAKPRGKKLDEAIRDLKKRETAEAAST